MKKLCLLVVFFCSSIAVNAQGVDKAITLSLFTGVMNYQGDLKPSSITLDHCSFTAGIVVRKPLNQQLFIRGGLIVGSIKASDAWNREDLQIRNLSFNTTIKEAYLGLEISILNTVTRFFNPYMYTGIAGFHFNPWTLDRSNKKVYLQPLGTEGQGISSYSEERLYKLTQFCIPLGLGLRLVFNDAVQLGIEINQRKSFTDYIDDVSRNYVDASMLMNVRGFKAVELAYRGDELSNIYITYPTQGEKRGSSSKMDWYYFFGTTLEIRISDKKNNNQRCPSNIAVFKY